MRIGLILALLTLAVPALAQTVRDRSGNLIGTYQERGDRLYFLDKSGNPRGYSRERSDGTIEYRTNAGDLVRTETPPHH